MAVEFSGKMKDGKTFFCRMKDIGLNTKRHWYSSRFTLRVRHQQPITFYSRVDSDLCASNGLSAELRMAEDMARLEAKGIDTSTIKFHS